VKFSLVFFNSLVYEYAGLQSLSNKSFKCGYCGDKVSSAIGYKIIDKRNNNQAGGVYVCSNCKGPTLFNVDEQQSPSGMVGNSVSNVPETLSALYEEARRCMVNNCNTAAVLVARKMLMNISVEQGAKEGMKFIEYVIYLSEQGYIPPNGKKWVDHIRKKGNEATHEITIMSSQNATELLFFIEMLLRFIYEFPNLIPEEAPVS
jgi:transcription elongation factor Elf1